MKRIIFIIGLIVLVIFISFILYKQSLPNVKKSTTIPPIESITQSWWPMYRGHQSLLGKVRSISSTMPVEKWRFQSSGTIRSGIAIGFGRVYFGNTHGKLYSLDQHTGQKMWEIDTGGSITATPLLIKEQNPGLFIGNEDGLFISVDAISGKIKWKSDFSYQINGGASYFYQNGELRIVFGAYDQRLHILDINGNELWYIETENYINGVPAYNDSLLVFGGCDQFLRAINPITGKEFRKVQLDSYIPSSPAISQNMAYVTLYKDKIYALNVFSGEVVWSYHAPNIKSIFTPPAVNEKYVVAIDQRGSVFVLRKKTGQFFREIEVNGKVKSDHLVDEKHLIVADMAGFIYVFNLDTGKEMWRLNHGAPISSPLVIIDNHLYVADHDGYLSVYNFTLSL